MHARPVWLFMAATAMATTVSTLAATAMVRADSAEPASVVCSCETPAPAAAPALAEPAAMPVEATAPTPIPDEPAELEQTRGVEPPAPEATVDGPLDKDIIRRVVRAHIGEVRYCYNQGLADDPELAGRVVVSFTIGTEGAVERHEIASSDLGDEEAAECISEAVGRWLFPKPADAKAVQVSYPFVLEPG